MSTVQTDMRALLLQKAMHQDPMRMGEGAFVGLCESNNVKIVRGGVGFAVKAFTVNTLIFNFLKGRTFHYILNDYQNGRLESEFEAYARATVQSIENDPIVLYLPDALSAHLSMGANKSVGLGGAEHELGHILCDKANKIPPSSYFKKVMPSIIDFIKSFNSNDYMNQYINSAAKFCNVFADVRLERMMPIMYPPTKHRFVDVQKCIFEMENEAIDQMSPLDALIFMIRDIGKNHVSQELTDRLAYYEKNFPQEWEMVHKEFMDLIKMNQCDTDDIDGTLHFPMVATWKFFLKVKHLQEQEDKKQQQQKGNGNPEEPCNGGGGDKAQGQGNGNQDKSEENKDKGNEEKKDKSKGNGNGEDDGEDENEGSEGKEGEKDSEKDSEDEIEDGRSDQPKKSQPKERSSTKTSTKDLIEAIKRKLDSGDFNADTLDALAKKAEQEIQKLNQQTKNETYICNGHSVVYVPRNKVQNGRVYL